MLKEFWDIVQREKDGDYMHRAPKKRLATKTSLNQPVSKCLINVNTLTLDSALSNETDNTTNIITSTTETKIINISTQSFTNADYSQYLDDS